MHARTHEIQWYERSSVTAVGVSTCSITSGIRCLLYTTRSLLLVALASRVFDRSSMVAVLQFCEYMSITCVDFCGKGVRTAVTPFCGSFFRRRYIVLCTSLTHTRFSSLHSLTAAVMSSAPMHLEYLRRSQSEQVSCASAALQLPQYAARRRIMRDPP